MNASTRHAQAGLSLAEMMLTMAIMAIVAGIGLPAFKGMLDRYRASTALSGLSAGIAQARVAAITRREYVVLCPGNAGEGCRSDGDWSHGWIIFHSRVHAPQPPSAASIIRESPLALPRHLKLASGTGRPRLRFTPMGRSDASNLTIAFCRNGESLGQLVVNNAGRSRRGSASTASACLP